jgi:hypothetical protein
MPRQHRAPADVIRDVLANGRVESPFSHQSLAQQILDCFVTCRIEVTTEDEREARRLPSEAPPPSGPIETLRYSIEAYEADKLVEVLGRETLAAPAIAAYERYAENDRKRLIMLRQGGRIVRRSDRED